MHKMTSSTLLVWMRAISKRIKWFGARKKDKEEDILEVTRKRLAELHAAWLQLDKETQYQIAKESAAQVGRTDEAFIQELLRQMM